MTHVGRAWVEPMKSSTMGSSWMAPAPKHRPMVHNTRNRGADSVTLSCTKHILSSRGRCFVKFCKISLGFLVILPIPWIMRKMWSLWEFVPFSFFFFFYISYIRGKGKKKKLKIMMVWTSGATILWPFKCGDHRFPNDGSEKCQTPCRAWPCRRFTPNHFAPCTKLFFRMESHNLVGGYGSESFSQLYWKKNALKCGRPNQGSLQFARKFMKPREFLCATNLQRILFPLWFHYSAENWNSRFLSSFSTVWDVFYNEKCISTCLKC